MDCPYQEFWMDGMNGCSLDGRECYGLPCDIATEALGEDDYGDDYDEET